jgi:hypothetical protein
MFESMFLDPRRIPTLVEIMPAPQGQSVLDGSVSGVTDKAMPQEQSAPSLTSRSPA